MSHLKQVRSTFKLIKIIDLFPKRFKIMFNLPSFRKEMQNTFYEGLFKRNHKNNVFSFGWSGVSVTSFLKGRLVYNKLPLKFKTHYSNNDIKAKD